MNRKKIKASKPTAHKEAVIVAVRDLAKKNKLKIWATAAGRGLFLIIFLGMLWAVLYGAHLLRR